MAAPFPWSRTHPWLDFRLRTSEIDISSWIRMGDLASKIRHLNLVPLSPTFRRELQTVSLTRGAQATTAIEGNTLSKEQVAAIIKGDDNHGVPPSKDYQGQEIRNVVDAFNRIAADLQQNRHRPVSADQFKEWNRRILDGDLPLASHVVPGEYSRARLTVGRYRALPVNQTHQAMERFCEFLNEQIEANAKVDGEEGRNWRFAYLAALAHLFFVWIHPFGDGNGRTARLLEFYICLKGGFPYTAAHLLAEHYNATRSDYYANLEAASTQHDKGGQGKFVAYAMKGLRDQLIAHIGRVMDELNRVTWKNHVYEALKEKTGTAWERRRELVLGMVRTGQSARKTIAVDEEVGELYEDETVTPRMISQDIRDLVKNELLTPHAKKRRDAVLSDILSRYEPGRIADQRPK